MNRLYIACFRRDPSDGKHHLTRVHWRGVPPLVYADDQVSFKRRPNLVPGLVEHVGKAWQNGQRLANFPEVFPVI
jgi:hypothetical protein